MNHNTDPPPLPEQLRTYLEGSPGWENTSPAVRSWARLRIWQAAEYVMQTLSPATRRERLDAAPAHLRPLIERDIKRMLRTRHPST